MTGGALSAALSGTRGALRRAKRMLPTVTTEPVREAPAPWRLALSTGLSMVSAAGLALVLTITLVSQLQHFTAQNALYEQARLELAEGSIPIGQTDLDGKLVQPGSPVAILLIPALGIREVIVEGTASSQTKLGVGHRRDTPLPGQPGSSVLMGRSAAYGGVFAHIDQLGFGSEIRVITGQGTSRYVVRGVRTAETELPVLSGNQSRLTLTTATGLPFVPNGVLRVDAELASPPFERPPVAVRSGVVDDEEQALASDTSGAFALSWLAELLLIMVIAATWIWKRLPRRVAWMLVAAPIACVTLAVCGGVASLLPNLL